MPRGRPRKIKDEVNAKDEVKTDKVKTDEAIKSTAVEKNVDVNVDVVEKGKKPAQDVEKNIPLNNDKDKNKSAKDAKDTRPICQCCGKKIDSSVRTLNLTYLTSIAPYRFEVENENGLVKVCGECALELGKVIETWMIEKGAKKKWSLE